jgi:citronellol/citronellal dehydrogenase
MEAAGGKAMAVQCDIRYEEQIQNVVDKTVETFGGIDILINNASAISLTTTEQTEVKRFDLMHSINVRELFYDKSLYSSFKEIFKCPHSHIVATGKYGSQMV